MLRRYTGRKAEELHRIALARLRRAQEQTAEYVRVRVQKALDEQFNAWDGEPDEAPTERTSENTPGAEEAGPTQGSGAEADGRADPSPPETP